MTTLEKAKAQLEGIDIYTKIENETLYVLIGETALELGRFEIEFRAKLFDEPRNEMVAHFVCKSHKKEGSEDKWDFGTGIWFTLEELKFNSDDHWLNSAIEKIEDEIAQGIKASDFDAEDVVALYSKDFDKTFDNVVQWIETYNELNQ